MRLLFGVFMGGGFLTTLVVGGVMLFAYWPERHLQAHYPIIALVIIGISLAPLIAFSLGLISMDTTGSLGLLSSFTAVGLYFFVGGICDHLLLVRTFKSVPEEGHEQAS